MLRYNDWQIPEGMEAANFYMPQWHDQAAGLINQTGHGSGDYIVMHKFFDAIRTGGKPDFDVYFATVMAAVAILSHRSLLAGGQPMDIPDFRREEDRVKYENDTLSPFFGDDGSAPTLPCCSHPDYRPLQDQIRRYMKITAQEK